MNATTPVTLRVSPTDYLEISNIERFSDGSGYASRLAVGASHFACSEYPFCFDNLPRFTEDLARAYDRVQGKARLGHAYEEDFIEIEVIKGGHVSVTGRVVEYGPPHLELRFAFGCDQTYLPLMLRSLTQVIAELDGKA